MPAALVFMQLAGGVCFVLWWAFRKAFVIFEEEVDRGAGEPLRAPGPAAAAPDRRPRQELARPAGAGQASISGQQGGARPRRRNASPAATRSARAPDDPRERSPRPPAPTMRRRSEAERSASSVGSVATNDSHSGTSREGPRPVRPAGAMETPAARGGPDAGSSAAPLGTPPQRGEAPSQAANQASRAQQPDSQPTASLRIAMEYAQRFRTREREGWDQNLRDPAATPTPSALRAQRMRARMNAGDTIP
jgi:hypothetical protein